jgi:hypothetical protein
MVALPLPDYGLSASSRRPRATARRSVCNTAGIRLGVGLLTCLPDLLCMGANGLPWTHNVRPPPLGPLAGPPSRQKNEAKPPTCTPGVRQREVGDQT